MKNNCLIILSLMLFLGMSLTSMAEETNAGPLESRTVDFIITNPDGASFYDFDDDGSLSVSTIPYKTVLTVFYLCNTAELTEKDPVFNGKRIGETRYNNTYGFIDLADAAVAEYDIPQNEIKKLEYPRTYTVVNKDGIAMYSGPSELYDVIYTIPYDADIVFTHMDKGQDGYANSFYYTEYNGYQGWVCYYPVTIKKSFSDLIRNLDIYSDYTGEIMVTGNNFRLKDVFTMRGGDYGEKIIDSIGGVIPKGTVLTFDKYYSTNAGAYALVKYNGVTGYINLDPKAAEVIIYINDTVITLDDSAVFSVFNDLSSRTDEIIPAYTVLPAKAYSYIVHGKFGLDSEEWVCVDYNGKDAWICNEANDETTIRRFSRYSWFYSYYKIRTGSAQLFDSFESDASVVSTVNDDDLFQGLFEKNGMMYIAVVGNNKAGWINTDLLKSADDDGLFVDNPDETSEYTDEAEETETQMSNANAASSTLGTADQDPENRNTSGNSKTIVVVCLAAIIVIILTVGITIIINKKKKEKKNTKEATS